MILDEKSLQAQVYLTEGFSVIRTYLHMRRLEHKAH